MSDTAILNGGLQELNAAKGHLLELDESKRRCMELEAAEITLEKSMEERRRSMDSEIARTLKKHKDEVTASYDAQISDIQTQHKKTASKRTKSKNMEISKRVAAETASLVNENKLLRSEIRTLFKKSHIPRLCNTDLFFSLFAPGNLMEFAILLVFILLAFLLIPCGIYFVILKETRLWMLAAIYFIDILVFGGIYFSIHHNMKEKHLKEIYSARQTRKKITANDRKIKAIKNSIVKDQDETPYDLEKYNQELESLSSRLSDLAKQKSDALAAFEANTKIQITKELEAPYQKDLAELQEKYDANHQSIHQLKDAIKDLSLYLTDHYEAYLGKDFLTEEKLNQMISLLEQRHAATVGEALAMVKQSV